MLIPVLPTRLASDDVQGSVDSLILQPIIVIAQKASQLNIYLKNSLFIETVLPFSLTAESRLLREDGRKLSFTERTRNSFMLWFLICFQLMTLSNNNTVSKPLLKAVRIYSNPISSESIFHKSLTRKELFSILCDLYNLRILERSGGNRFYCQLAPIHYLLWKLSYKQGICNRNRLYTKQKQSTNLYGHGDLFLQVLSLLL